MYVNAEDVGGVVERSDESTCVGIAKNVRIFDVYKELHCCISSHDTVSRFFCEALAKALECDYLGSKRHPSNGACAAKILKFEHDPCVRITSFGFQTNGIQQHIRPLRDF